MSYMRWKSKLTGKFATEWFARDTRSPTTPSVGSSSRVLTSLGHLGVGLERVTQAVQQTQHRATSKALVHQFCSQLRRRLRRPVQLRHRVSPSLGIHQFVEGLEQAGLGVGQRLVATASPDRPRICPVPSQTLRSLPDQRMAEPCRRLNASGPRARATAPSQSEANATAVVEDIRSLVLRHRGRSRRR